MTTSPSLMPAALEPAAPVAPDAAWLTIRDRVAAGLAAAAATGAAPGWTDHNAPDPGITLMEAAAFAIADVHYRVEEAGFDGWPLTWHGWLDVEQRRWQGALPEARLDAPLALRALADAVAALLAVPGRDAEREVGAAASRADAEALLSAPPFAALVAAEVRPHAVALLRSRLLRRVALEHADVVADAVAEADSRGGSGAERDAAAAAELGLRTGLWAHECAGLVLRERRRLVTEAAGGFAGRIESATVADLPGLLADLTGAGLTADEAYVAAAAPRVPALATPEGLEGTDGCTTVWPPHPVQALTCEPVIADDYARRARTHSAVRRAWTVNGRLKGIAWNGLPTRDETYIPPANSAEEAFGVWWAVDPDAPALTIIVEAPTVADADEGTLRAILAHAVGSEPYTAAPSWRDTFDTLDPRRLMCDEVGIALLEHLQVIVQATLVIPPTASRTAVLADAAARVQAFFEAGRKETPAPPLEDPLSGPWAPAQQPAGGWVPGDPVRFSEVVEQLMGVPEVIAVTKMAMKTVLDDDWTLADAGALELPKGAVPDLAVDGCFTTEFLVAGACDA